MSLTLVKNPEVQAHLDAVLAGTVRDPVTLYALWSGMGKVVAGPWVRLACERHLRDLERDDLIWDLPDALRAVDFFPEVLVFTDGQKVGNPFELELWQQFFVGSLFGWKTLDETRRYRTAYAEIGKGNGKSPMAGGIGVYMLVADSEGAPEVYAAATKLEQAKILWNDAKRMVENSPELRDLVDVRQNLLLYPAKNGIFRPISSEKRGLDGPRVHCGLIDEVHEHSDATVVNKLRAGTKGRTQALILEITNSGFDKQTICYQHHEYTIRILKQQEVNDSWFGFICALDEEDDWEKDKSCWIKSNPNLGVSIQEKYLQEQILEAKGMPAKRSIVERLNFCKWVGAENPWVDEALWKACKLDQGTVDWDKLRGVKCWLALDLSSRKDLTALAQVWELEEGFIGRVFYYAPEKDLEKRAKDDKVPYDIWAKEGYLLLTPGGIVDYGHVAAKVAELDAEFNVEALAFDPWRIGLMEKELDAIGCDVKLVRHGQGYQGKPIQADDESKPFKKANEAGDDGILWMPGSIEAWETLIIQGKYWTEAHPITDMCIANAVTISDAAGNRKFEKRRASGRMDGTVAQAMAVGAAKAASGPRKSKYNEAGRGLLVL
jgi:phage terminase large subunit-like protein